MVEALGTAFDSRGSLMAIFGKTEESSVFDMVRKVVDFFSPVVESPWLISFAISVLLFIVYLYIKTCSKL